MKKTYLVQLIIDAMVIAFGLILYLFPGACSLNPNAAFYITMGIYAGLELAEYIFDRTRLEPLCMFFASGTAAFSGLVLRDYTANYVLSITIAVWILMYIIIKMMSLGEIDKRKTHLFMIRLLCMSAFTIVGIIVSMNIYFRIDAIGFMLALLYLSYGAIEIIGDFLSYLSEDVKFIKE